MPQIELVLEMLRKDLSAPRVLLAQVVNYITDHYGYATAEFERFFSEKYPQLEDYEVDLVFSPQYTPAEHNRLEYIPLLGVRHLSSEDLLEIKRRLREENLQTVLKSPDEQAEVSIGVHEVFIDRYVNLLKLDQPLPEAIAREISASVPEESRNEVNLLGRDEVWAGEARADILVAFLRAFKARDNFSVPKVSFLTGFMRTYRPASIFDLHRQFDALIDSCRKDMENVSGRGFHDEYLRSLHGAERLNKGEESDVWEHYRRMTDMAEQLKADYVILDQVAPEIITAARQQQPA